MTNLVLCSHFEHIFSVIQTSPKSRLQLRERHHLKGFRICYYCWLWGCERFLSILWQRLQEYSCFYCWTYFKSWTYLQRTEDIFCYHCELFSKKWSWFWRGTIRTGILGAWIVGASTLCILIIVFNFNYLLGKPFQLIMKIKTLEFQNLRNKMCGKSSLQNWRCFFQEKYYIWKHESIFGLFRFNWV